MASLSPLLVCLLTAFALLFQFAAAYSSSDASESYHATQSVVGLPLSDGVAESALSMCTGRWPTRYCGWFAVKRSNSEIVSVACYNELQEVCMRNPIYAGESTRNRYSQCDNCEPCKAAFRPPSGPTVESLRAYCYCTCGSTAYGVSASSGVFRCNRMCNDRRDCSVSSSRRGADEPSTKICNNYKSNTGMQFNFMNLIYFGVAFVVIGGTAIALRCLFPNLFNRRRNMDACLGLHRRQAPAPAVAVGQRQQPGMMQPQPGMMQPQPGMMQPQPGMMQPQPGMMQPQPGMMQPQSSMMQPQPGMMQPQPGMMQPQSSMMQPQPGMMQPPTKANEKCEPTLPPYDP